jgi:hypothetical protein
LRPRVAEKCFWLTLHSPSYPAKDQRAIPGARNDPLEISGALPTILWNGLARRR